MKTLSLRLPALVLLALIVPRPSVAAPDASAPKDLNTPRDFPTISSLKEWQVRARETREQVLVSCGLWPLPEKTPLNAHLFGKIDRDGYSVEKVYIQTYPGLYLGGNLYRPLGKGKGPFPAILNPHGHWGNGRMADEKDGSIAGRCISFARQGMIAFSYDMVGYNDTRFADSPANRSFGDLHHQFATEAANQLWNINLMGLQTWDSIRALDFLESLPDADPKHLACTGASGGGTQTFILGAVDDRLAAQAPVVMVSHTMQGGCLCENAPGLRVEYSNMEFAARPAPRPQILVAAKGDWTKDTPTVEGPAIARIYQLFGAPDNLRYVRFDFGHNYNQTSREAVYAWLDHWLLHSPLADAVPEAPFQKEPDADLRVFPDNKLPAGALTQRELIDSLKQMHQAQWRALLPHTRTGLKRFKKQMLPAWRHTLELPAAPNPPQVQSDGLQTSGEFTTATIRISRPTESRQVLATYWAPREILKQRAPRLVVLCAPVNGSTASDRSTVPSGLTLDLLQHGLAVLHIDQFSTGEPPDQFASFYTTYNRTKVQERVRDLQGICAASQSIDPRKSVPLRVILLGTGQAGLWALLAAPAAQAVVADCGQLDLSHEQNLLSPDLFCPGLLSMGGFQTAAILAAPHPVLLHNTGSAFPTAAIASIYHATKPSAFRTEKGLLPDTQLAAWISDQTVTK